MTTYDTFMKRAQKTSEMLGSSQTRLTIMQKLVKDCEAGPWNNNIRDIVYDYVIELLDHDEARCRSTLDELGAP